MPDQNRRELAKQGDPKAIADAINQSLKPRGISADVMRDNGCLHVMIEGDAVPTNQQALVNFIRNGMEKLGVQSIYSIKIYGRQFGDDLPVWEEEIALKVPQNQAFETLPSPEPTPAFSTAKNVETPPKMPDEEFDVIGDDDDNFNDDYNIDDDEEIDDEEEEINDEVPYNPEEDDDPDEIDDEATKQVEPQKEKAKNTRLLLIILLAVLAALAALAGLHFSGIFRLPFLPGGSSTSSTESTSDPSSTTTPGKASTSTSAPATADPWRDAVNKAMSAAKLAQTANTKADWNKVASEWQQAVDLMKKVPQSNPNYQTAQQKAVDYQKNLDVAKQRAAQAP